MKKLWNAFYNIVQNPIYWLSLILAQSFSLPFIISIDGWTLLNILGTISLIPMIMIFAAKLSDWEIK